MYKGAPFLGGFIPGDYACTRQGLIPNNTEFLMIME